MTRTFRPSIERSGNTELGPGLRFWHKGRASVAEDRQPRAILLSLRSGGLKDKGERRKHLITRNFQTNNFDHQRDNGRERHGWFYPKVK